MSSSFQTIDLLPQAEVPTVFLPGWEDGLFPSQRSMDENGLKGLEEERRLAYVGLTRAKRAHVRERAEFLHHRANRLDRGAVAAGHDRHQPRRARQLRDLLGDRRDLVEIETFCNGFSRRVPKMVLTSLRFASIVGPGAGELIAEGVLAIEMGAVIEDLSLTIHPHPTLSETVMEAAEVYHGHSAHFYKRPRK